MKGSRCEWPAMTAMVLLLTGPAQHAAVGDQARVQARHTDAATPKHGQVDMRVSTDSSAVL